ncbi:unnamed protein product [Mytilus coruscus]|uniref:Uncharacterized protein n=1 Tax=Mytilus coruscus TaxID=42192 RepID=A0A6J8E4F2_MYTCO|nr:unnamed protein product [Mytilus coruscus]
MDFKLRYEKTTLYDLPVIHTPCNLCNKDSSTKHEIESMLNSIDQTASLDKDLTGIYHYLVHSNTQDGIRLLYWMDSEKLVWLYELVRCLDNDTGHGIRIKMMVVDVMHEREKVNKTIVMSQAVLVDKGGQSHVPHDSPVPSPSAYSRQEIESDVDQS